MGWPDLRYPGKLRNFSLAAALQRLDYQPRILGRFLEPEDSHPPASSPVKGQLGPLPVPVNALIKAGEEAIDRVGLQQTVGSQLVEQPGIGLGFVPGLGQTSKGRQMGRAAIFR